MSKFKREFTNGRHVFTKDLCSFSVEPSELSDLASCVSSALAEQNKREEEAGNWEFERCSGYPGYRCQKCFTWVYADQTKKCSCHSTQSTDQAPSTRTEG